MRRLTLWLNMLATIALLGALYTGLDTITHKAASPIFHGFVAFITIFLTAGTLANSMLYINTLQKDIDELKKEIDQLRDNEQSSGKSEQNT